MEPEKESRKMEPQKVLFYPLMGEKATLLRETENKLSFIVDKNSNSNEVKQAVESLYNVKVMSVNVMITSEGKKKAIVRLDPKHSAEEIASHFGVM
jgi:large subunit ribosomal protein L23